MLFSSNVFLFAFLPSALLVYYLVPRALKTPSLLLWSLVFYGFGEPVYLFLMLATIAVNYTFGLGIHACRLKNKSAKGLLAAGVTVNLLLLGFFKYAGFFVAQLKALLPFMAGVHTPSIALPIGISFYIFQSMSYIIDIYRNDAPVQKNILTFGTYVTLFPQLIAGPIVRYSDVASQLENRKESVEKFARGVERFVIGLSKKLLLANPMGIAWELLREQNGTLAAWVGIVAYSLQIYFDFSGYSDMAIGLGQLFGFNFLENFNYPYISSTITDFWRRWHISLSTWFKEYVYIPLGGNRKGLPRRLVNLLVVWGLTGFWHGASWNFLLWGLYYAVLLIIEKLFLLKWLQKLPKFVGHFYSLLAVVLGWALFFFEDIGALGAFFSKLFTLSTTDPHAIRLVLGFLPLFLICFVAATPLAKTLGEKRQHSPLVRYGKVVVCAILLLLCVASLASNSYNPFIYFRF